METNIPISPKADFPKAEKMKSRKAIDGLFKGGKSFFIHPYKVFYKVVVENSQLSIGNSQLQTSDNEHVEDIITTEQIFLPVADGSKLIAQSSQLKKAASVQAGFAVSTRNFKHAVDRNRIKRLGREAYRLNKHLLIPHFEKQGVKLQVFFVFTNKTLPTFVNIQAAMQACMRKLVKNIQSPKK